MRTAAHGAAAGKGAAGPVEPAPATTGLEPLSAPDRATALRRSWPLLAPHRWRMAAAVAISAGATLAELAGPVLVGAAVDAVVATDRGRLVAVAGAYGVLSVALLVLEQARRQLAARAGEAFLADVRRLVARRLVARPLGFFDRHPAGELVARSTTDVEALSRFVRNGLPGLVDALLLLALTSVVLAAISWPLALVTLVYLPPLAAAVRRFRRDSGPAYAAYADAAAATTAVVGETLAARPLLLGVGATGPWAARVAAADRRLLDTNDGGLRADNRLSVLGLWQQLTLALVVLAGGLLAGRGDVSVGVVATFALALRQLFRPLDSLSWLYAEAEQARANLARILEVVAGPDLAPAGPSPGRGEGGLDVELDGVTYSYGGDGEPALADVDLRITAGERVAIVGPTGSGKSTLAKVAAGLLEPGAGEVRIGGRPVAAWDAPALRRAVVLVPQEGHVLAGTLADNLRLVPGHHDDAALDAAVDRAGLRAWLDRLPAGLGTELTDRGANLSAGERQLVALARAALADPQVLVLDEATADVDPATEALVAGALDLLTAGRTVVVVAHRPATAARCHRSVRLQSGRTQPPTKG